MDRRTFLKVSAGAGAGLWTSAAFGEIGDRRDSLTPAHFPPDHVVPASRLTAPSTAVVKAIRQWVEREKLLWSWETSTSLQMPNAKLTFLIAMMRQIIGHYSRPDLFTDWTHRLVRREEFAGTAYQGVGLGHEFQRRQELSTLERDVDWWGFLIPDGIEFDAIDGKPVYLIMVPVFGQGGMKQNIESWAAAMRLVKFLSPQRVARKPTNEATDGLNRALSQSLHEVRNRESSNMNGRHSR